MTNSWYSKYQKLSKNYKEEVKQLIEKNKEPSKISNHVIFNCTGRYLKLNKLYLNKKKTEESNKNEVEESGNNSLIDIIVPNGNAY